jgi:hypothetical protein
MLSATPIIAPDRSHRAMSSPGELWATPLWQSAGLKCQPFAPSAHFVALPMYLALSSQLKKYLKSNAMTLLIGEDDVGKTSFAKAYFKRHIPHGAWIQGSAGTTFTNLIKAIALSIQQAPPPLSDPKERQLHTLKRAIASHSDYFTIVIDDANQLPLTSLAALMHLLAHETNLTLSIILIGNNDLQEKISSLTMRGEQGIKTHLLSCHCWQRKDIKMYAQEKMNLAGWRGEMPKLGRKFWEELQSKTGGHPSHVNQALHHHLLTKIMTAPKNTALDYLQSPQTLLSVAMLLGLYFVTPQLPQKCLYFSDDVVDFLLNHLDTPTIDAKKA